MKRIKKIFSRAIPYIAAASLLLGGCATENPGNYSMAERRRDLTRSLVERAHLCVNTENKFRYFSRMSEEQGDRELSKLCLSSRFEESYVFVPKENLWIEIGLRRKIR